MKPVNICGRDTWKVKSVALNLTETIMFSMKDGWWESKCDENLAFIKCERLEKRVNRGNPHCFLPEPLVLMFSALPVDYQVTILRTYTHYFIYHGLSVWRLNLPMVKACLRSSRIVAVILIYLFFFSLIILLTDPYSGGTVSERKLCTLGSLWSSLVSPAGLLSTRSNSNIWHGD